MKRSRLPLPFALTFTTLASVSMPSAAAAADDDDADVVPVSSLPAHDRLPPPLEVSYVRSPDAPPMSNVAWRSRGGTEVLETVEGCFRSGGEVHGMPPLEAVVYDPKVVRAQRVVLDPDGAPMLEITDGWVDEHKATHLARTTEMPLAVVARGPHGLVAYAYRVGTRVIVLTVGNRIATKSVWVECQMTQTTLDAAPKQGDESHAPVRIDKKTSVMVSASVTRFGADHAPRLAVSFSFDE